MASIYWTTTTATRKALQMRLQKAYQNGDRRLVRRITALLSLAQSQQVTRAAEVAGVTRQRVQMLGLAAGRRLRIQLLPGRFYGMITVTVVTHGRLLVLW